MNLRNFIATVLLSTALVPAANAQVQIGASFTFQNFYDDLSPYGTWMDYPGYGQMWRPSVDGDFRPYLTNGYWDYAGDSWTWMSNYSWGWAPFHYGRWLYDDFYGWLWLPGYDWSPAWVNWGISGGYYAWAPLMPGIDVSVGYASWRPAAIYWNFCPQAHLGDHDLGRWAPGRVEVRHGYADIHIVDNFQRTGDHDRYYSAGPRKEEVEQYTGHAIQPRSFNDVQRFEDHAMQSSPERSNIDVYRPRVFEPMPQEYRRVERDNVAPIREGTDRFNEGIRPEEQQRNFNSLPMSRGAQMERGGMMRGGGGRR